MASRIFKSIDQAAQPVQEANFDQRRFAAPASTRPKGGFQGVVGGAVAGPPLSRHEQREQEARRILEDAQSRAETIQRDAYHAGFEEGERAGLKLASQKIEPALQMLTDIIQSVSEQRDALRRQHENELIRIAFLIAEQVIHTALQLEPKIVNEIVGSALEKVAKNQTVTLLVSPQDLTLVQQHVTRAQSPFMQGEHVKLKADESIARGGCRLITDTGDIDATIESQLRAMQNNLW